MGAMHVLVVDAGTSVKNERDGSEIVVTDECAAQKGNVIFCTQKTYDALAKAVNTPKDTPND